MKNILNLFAILCLSLEAMSQDASFFQDRWKVLEIKNTFKGYETHLFHRDSASNVLEYANYEVKFLQDGSYNGISPSGKTYKGTWLMNLAKDTIVIDNDLYQLTLLNSNNLTMRTFNLQIADTLGNLDTAYIDFTMYSIPDIITSHYETALGSEHVKVFPNPAKDQIELQLVDGQNEGIAGIFLSSITGQKVLQWIPVKNESMYKMDLCELKNGLYLLEVINKDGRRIAIKKVMKE